MKKVVVFILMVMVMASCSFETLQCHSYGHTNQKTKHGGKAQAKYHKVAKRNI
jgi:hypothetical protein